MLGVGLLPPAGARRPGLSFRSA